MATKEFGRMSLTFDRFLYKCSKKGVYTEGSLFEEFQI
jgi:hypothetical protein